MSTIETRLRALERARRRGRILFAGGLILGLSIWVPVHWSAAAEEVRAGAIPAGGEPVSFFHTLQTQELQFVDTAHDLIFTLAPAPDRKGLAFLDAKGTMLAQVGPVNGGGGITVFNGQGRPVCIVTFDRQGGGLIQLADKTGAWRATLP